MSETKSRYAARHGISIGIIVVLAGIAWLALSTPEPGASAQEPENPLQALRPQLVTNRPAPDFALPDRNGRIHRLSEHRGRPVVLNFWSIDCPPCVQELPSLLQLAQRGNERGSFTVISVTVDQNWDAVRRLFPEGTEMPVLFDPERTVVRERFGTERFPETFLIDSRGNMRARFDGPRSWSSPVVLQALAFVEGHQ